MIPGLGYDLTRRAVGMAVRRIIFGKIVGKVYATFSCVIDNQRGKW